MSAVPSAIADREVVCPICWEDCQTPQERVKHHPSASSEPLVACIYQIHIRCLDAWFRQPAARGRCPMCRAGNVTWFTEMESEDGTTGERVVSFAEAREAGVQEPPVVGYRFFHSWEVRPIGLAHFVGKSMLMLVMILTVFLPSFLVFCIFGPGLGMALTSCLGSILGYLLGLITIGFMNPLTE